MSTGMKTRDQSKGLKSRCIGAENILIFIEVYIKENKDVHSNTKGTRSARNLRSIERLLLRGANPACNKKLQLYRHIDLIDAFLDDRFGLCQKSRGNGKSGVGSYAS